MPQLAIVGAGATGTRVARHVSRSNPEFDITLIDDGEGVATTAAAGLDSTVRAAFGTQIPMDSDIVVIATRAETHAEIAKQSVGLARVIISVADSVADIRALLDMEAEARDKDSTIVVGAGMMPGLSDVLVAHGSTWFDSVREIHVAKFGTGGPDCARQHHRALKSMCLDWRDDHWRRRPGGSGRELAWFPAPVEAADCYRAALGDPLLLVRANPSVERITARMAATRRDRLTMNFPMLRKPHAEGLLGAVRAELRGLAGGQQLEVVLGSAERPAVVAGVVAAATVSAATEQSESWPVGVFGLAELVESTQFLHSLRRRGIRPEIFVGADETY